MDSIGSIRQEFSCFFRKSNLTFQKKYEWDTGEDLEYSSWGDGQPNWRDPYGKDGEEECVIMWSDATWHDYNCRVRSLKKKLFYDPRFERISSAKFLFMKKEIF